MTLDEHSDEVAADVAVVDRRGDLDHGGRLTDRLHSDDRWPALSASWRNAKARATKRPSDVGGRALEPSGAGLPVEKGGIGPQKALAHVASIGDRCVATGGAAEDDWRRRVDR